MSFSFSRLHSGRYTAIVLVLLLFCSALHAQIPPGSSYPEAATVDQADTYHGTVVQDPFRWLEDLDSDEVKAWREEQDDFLDRIRRKYLRSYTGLLASISMDYTHRLFGHTMHDIASVKRVWRQGGYTFRLQEIANHKMMLFYTPEGSSDTKPLLQVDELRAYRDEIIRVSSVYMNEEDTRAAVVVRRSGTDLREVHVVDLESGTPTGDVVEGLRSSLVGWCKDGFYYVEFSGSDLFDRVQEQRLMYHTLGTKQKDDIQIVRQEVTDGILSLSVPTSDSVRLHETLLVEFVSKHGSRKFFNAAQLHIGHTGEGLPELQPYLTIPLEDNIDFRVLYKEDDEILAYSNVGAPNGQVLRYNTRMRNQAKLIIPEFQERLEDVARLGDYLFAVYLMDGVSSGYLLDTLGETINQVRFPEGYSLANLAVDYDDSTFVYYVTSFFQPGCVYSFHPRTKIVDHLYGEPLQETDIHYITKIVEYPSKDGTMIPMYITHRRDMERDANTPLLLYGYGGFGVSTKPFYSYFNDHILRRGKGIMAAPCIRGGGEFGQAWHNAGRRLNKQNTFDDFIAAAEYLIEEGYTSPEKLAIQGGSHGGLLVTAAMTQRPELFGAVIAEAPVTDMIRHSQHTTRGLSLDEYGSPQDSVDFFNLLSYSPLHNLKESVAYPPIILVTGDHDDRVHPSHSFKFAAALQAIMGQQESGQVLLKVTEQAGHSGSDNDRYDQEKDAYIMAWLKYHLDF